MAYSEESSAILNRMLGNMSDNVDKTEGYLVYDDLTATSIEFNKALSKLDEVATKFDISNLTGDELATRVYERTGISRNLATFATTPLTIVGNATINIGDLFQTPSRVQFTAIETVTITGTGIVNIKALISGATGMVPANQIIATPIAISGVVSITNPSPTIGGYDSETDAALLLRYYAKIQSPQTGGNIAQFISLIKAYSGVGDVKVYPTWNGNNTIKLVIIDSNKLPLSSDFINLVQTYMDPLGATWGQGYGVAPFGAFTTVASATSKTITVNFTAIKDLDYSDVQRQTNIELAITNYLKSIAFVSTSVSYTKIGALIIDTDGFLDYTGLTINGGTTNISLSYTSTLTECPVKGVVTIA